MKINIPELCLVVLMGSSGSGKSTFAKRHFLPTEVVSSDACRGWVSNDENNQAASQDAFDLLHYLVAKRLARGLLTVVDATNVQEEARKNLLKIARDNHCFAIVIALDVDDEICIARNFLRQNRQFGEHVIFQQRRQFKRSLRFLEKEGFRDAHVLKNPDEIDQISIARESLWVNRKLLAGPFDIIGDVHGCFDELCVLLKKLGYTLIDKGSSVSPRFDLKAPIVNGIARQLIFVGDLVDRGPNTPDVLRLVKHLVENGQALCVAGNHDVKLMKALNGKQVKVSHGLAESLTQFESIDQHERNQICQFLKGLVSHYVLDDGQLVVAHAGLKEAYHGRTSRIVREFAMYGETTGEIDDDGLPVRQDWAADYRGQAMVVYGHTPVPRAEWVNNTICLDTGCVFGGKLTALRYPERELVSIDALREHYAPIRPLEIAQHTQAKEIGHDVLVNSLSTQQQLDDVLDIIEVIGQPGAVHRIQTSLKTNIQIRPENKAAALEVMSRFTIHPKWLIYLPPTMSPSETALQGDYLEHPQQAFEYYAKQGINQVICEEKHMGSRVVVIVCKDEAVAYRRFGFDATIHEPSLGVIYTRTGRPFFKALATEQAFLARIQEAMNKANLWDTLKTDWICLDAELMPWSAKAQSLIRQQYAAVGCAAHHSLKAANAWLEKANQRGLDVCEMQRTYQTRATLIEQYIQAYQAYCWQVESLDDYQLAPFHILAGESATYVDQPHEWHLQTLAQLANVCPKNILATPYRVVDIHDAKSCEDATNWWLELTKKGGEGMVVKPTNFITRTAKGVLQPAVKCRGREYLRIIYGPEYTQDTQLPRLRKRALATKRSLAMREFALGVESLQHFVNRQPLRKIHECVFGVLALESQAIDPRL